MRTIITFDNDLENSCSTRPAAPMTDYSDDGVKLWMLMKLRGIDITRTKTLDDFLAEDNHFRYSVLLMRTGIDNIYDMRKILNNYPDQSL